MSVKICPDGGLHLASVDGFGEYQITWDEGSVRVLPLGENYDAIYKHVGSLVGLLVNFLGGGLQVEFDQSLLTATPGCVPNTDPQVELTRRDLRDLSSGILALAGKLGIDLPAGDSSARTVEQALHFITEQVTQAQESELDTAEKLPPGAGPGETIDVNGPPQAQASIGGIAVGEAPAGQPKRARRTKAQIEADNAAAEAAKKSAVAPAASAVPVAPAQPTPPNPEATAAFKADMGAIEAKLPPPATVPVKPPAEEPVTVAVKDELDEMVELLSNPPLPVDLHPLDVKRNPSDQQFLDTAGVRLHFGYALVNEYKADPNFKPAAPPNSPVNMGTDEGVVAVTQWMHKIAERAARNGKPIGQLDMMFGLGTIEEVVIDGVEKVRKRREAAAARRAAAAGQ